jgi:hypothetical protein
VNLVEAEVEVEAELKVDSGEWKSFCRLRLTSDNT